MLRNKGQVESPSWLIGPLLIVGLVSLGAFAALQSYSQINFRIESGSAKLQAINMENRLISSKDCLSTGEIGVLNRSKLEEFKQKGNILNECPPVPSVSYRMGVRDISSGESWTLGDSKLTESPDSNRSIAIVSDSKVNPGRVVLYFFTAQDDVILALRKNIASAWVAGKDKTVINLNSSYQIEFPDEKIKNKDNGRELPLKIPGRRELITVSNSGLSLSKGQTKISFERENGNVKISTGW